MKYIPYAFASLLALSASSAAFAAGENFTNSGSTANNTVTYAGNGATLTHAGTATSGGAAWADNALSSASGFNFSTDFNFSMTAAQGANVAGNGFAFVLTPEADAAGVLGSTNANLGVGPTPGAFPTLQVDFSPYANKTNNPGYGNGYYSNLVYITTGGSAVVNAADLTSWSEVSGTPQCGGTSGVALTSPNCLGNGSLWSAHIAYSNGLLTVSINDGGVLTTLNYAINLATYFAGATSLAAGFAASTGAVTETTQISNWTFAVPEPASLAAFGVGLAALGLVRGRRRTASV